MNQQKEMLTRVLDHKLLSTVRLNHWMNQKDVVAISKIMGNVKVGCTLYMKVKAKTNWLQNMQH